MSVILDSLKIEEKYSLNDLDREEGPALGRLVSMGLVKQDTGHYWIIPTKGDTSVGEVTKRLMGYLVDADLINGEGISSNSILKDVISSSRVGFQGEGIELADFISKEYGGHLDDIVKIFRENDVGEAARKIYASLLEL